MRRSRFLVLFLLILAVVCGQLLSGMSRFGQFGVSWIYTEYGFLRVWWQAAAVVLAVWLMLHLLHRLAHRFCSRPVFRMIGAISIIAALAGLYATYQDFRSTLTHHWLGERFHIGAYLFWVGWIVIAVFYLQLPKLQVSKKKVERPQ